MIDGRRLTATRTGVGRYLEGLLADWAETGWPSAETVLVVEDRSVLGRWGDIPGVRTLLVGEGWPGLAWERWGLGRVLRPGDLLFAPTNLIPGNWRGATVLVVFDTLIESHPQGFDRLTRLRFRARYRSSARRATRIVVPSETTREEVLRHFGIRPDRIETIYPGVGPEFRPRSSPDPVVLGAREAVGVGRRPFFLFVGKPSARRNVAAIREAFSRIDDSEIRLLFVGPTPQRRRPAEGTDPRIIEAGHVSDEVLQGLLSGAVACLYPSESEGFGLPVIEAMASGCPVVTVRTGALIESGGDAAVFVDRPDADSLERRMRQLMTDRAFRDDHVRSGLVQASRFPIPRFAAEVRRVLRGEAGLALGPTGR